MAELWRRPWAMADVKGRHREKLDGKDVSVDGTYSGPLWLFVPKGDKVRINGKLDTAEPVAGFRDGGQGRELLLLPLPLRSKPPLVIGAGDEAVEVSWPDLPERPSSKSDPQTEREHEAHRLLLRAKAVWDRLSDVDAALADPAQLWPELRRRWTDEDPERPPQMNVIVQHALTLARTLDVLERAPRRVLRRTHQQMPVSRVQELDRQAMTWLVRQPGDTLAERAGDRQRILAVAREENYDTLENRVLRSYADLAGRVARDYVARNRSKSHTRRARRVEEFGKRCRRISHDLAQLGVRLAEAGVTPNFVLQNNPNYHEIWTSWRELLRLESRDDELWRWQARSWEEFTALALIVALVGLPGARIIASSPLVFRDEQSRGSWIDDDKLLVVFHLAKQGLVVEVRYRMPHPAVGLGDYGAPIWIRIGRVNAVDQFLANIPVWPIWDYRGGLVEGEASEVDAALALGKRSQIVKGVVIRPVAEGRGVATDRSGRALTATLGVEGPALWQGIEGLTHFFASYVEEHHPA